MTDKLMGELYDIKGIPIYPGDLLRTYHFTGRRNKIYYLYHVATKDGHGLRLLPAEWADPNCKRSGGAYYPSQKDLDGLSAIVLNHYNAGDSCGEPRKRKKL